LSWYDKIESDIRLVVVNKPDADKEPGKVYVEGYVHGVFEWVDTDYCRMKAEMKEKVDCSTEETSKLYTCDEHEDA
jgi:hypothetical protein